MTVTPGVRVNTAAGNPQGEDMSSGTGSQTETAGFYGEHRNPFRGAPRGGNGSGRPGELLEESYLKVHEFADILRLSPMTVYRMVDDQEIGAVRPGPHTIRIPESSAKGYLESRRLPLQGSTAWSHNLLAEQYLTVQEMAGILRVSVMTVYRVLERGLLDAIRVAPHVIRIVKMSAEEYVCSATQNTPRVLPAYGTPTLARLQPAGATLPPPRWLP
jgi:excisionase family DNA binding protein